MSSYYPPQKTMERMFVRVLTMIHLPAYVFQRYCNVSIMCRLITHYEDFYGLSQQSSPCNHSYINRLPYFCSRSFTVSDLMFNSLIHFQLMFVYNV